MIPVERLWAWIAVALPAFVALLVPLPAVDLAYQVRAGNEILATGAIPAMDTWTFTIWGRPWLDQQWLAQVLLAAVHGLGGWELLAVLRAALVAATTGLLVATARALGTGPRTAAILSLAAFGLAAPALALRPQLFAIVLFAALLLLVAGRARWPGAYLGAPLLVVAWANLHGSFVLGPVLLGWAWLSDLAAGRPARRSLWVLVAGSLATLATPFLFFAWTYAAGIGANPVIAGRVSEWQRTSPLEMPGLLFYPSVVVTAALLARRRTVLAWPTWLLAAGMALIGAWAVRGVAWWALVMVLLLATVLAAGPGRSPQRAPQAAPATPARDARARRAGRLNGATAALLGVLIVAALPWWRPADPLTGRTGLLSYAPSGLAAALPKAVPGGARVALPQTWASWFEWAAPRQAYFLDSRFELFPADAWADYAALRTPGAAQGEALDRWAVDALIVPAGEPGPGGGWTAAYADVDGTLYVRAP